MALIVQAQLACLRKTEFSVILRGHLTAFLNGSPVNRDDVNRDDDAFASTRDDDARGCRGCMIGYYTAVELRSRAYPTGLCMTCVS